MSHFFTLVLVDPGTAREDVRDEVSRLVDRYSEDTEMPEYDRNCGCGDRKAGQDAAEHANATVRPLKDLREEYHARVGAELGGDARYAEIAARSAAHEKLSDEDEAYLGSEGQEAAEARAAATHGTWEEHVAGWVAAHDAHRDAHPLRGKADPECGFYSGERQGWWPDGAKDGDRFEDGSGCGGAGTYRSTYNQDSKWDWWVVGGRWTGALDPSYDPYTDPQNQETCHLCEGTGKRDDRLGRETRATNPAYGCNGCQGAGTSVKWSLAEFAGDVAPVRDVMAALAERPPFALVTPDGEWHQKADMGWWGMTRNEKDRDDWNAEARAILADHPDHVAVVVDMHI